MEDLPDYVPPKVIAIKSDDSEAEFVSNKNGIITYRYTKGFEKVGNLVKWTEAYIKEQLQNYFVIIEHGITEIVEEKPVKKQDPVFKTPIKKKEVQQIGLF